MRILPTPAQHQCVVFEFQGQIYILKNIPNYIQDNFQKGEP